MPPRDRKNAVVLTVLASLIWGTSFPGTKWGLQFAGNDVVFLWFRFLVASAITLSVVLYLRRLSPSFFKNPRIWAVGGLNMAGFVTQYVALTITTSSKTALLVDINVVAVAIISYFVFIERLNKWQVTGIVMGTVGVVFVSLNKDLVFDTDQILGDALAYLAGWSWAFFIILGKRLLDDHSAVEVSSAAITTCFVWLSIPTAYVIMTGADLSMQPTAWPAVFYLGLFCTSIATLLWALGLEGVSATSSATIMLIEVLTALALSYTLLDERLSSAALVGAVLVLAAIYLVSSRAGPVEKPSVKQA